ncbi:MAG: murein transglycosylase domain-containing protein [Sulfurospirillaceae bacterium]|nr:murein transglycosylase domain-containing protein [Sulfurospirillaceae bacterium]MCK9545436.1 murein transglycosylase domain-containing protein [Sulfurospirillaceae bacterium]
MRVFIFFITIFILSGCAKSDYKAIADVAFSNDPASAAKVLARNKSIHYANNPEKLVTDIKSIDLNIEKLFTALFGKVAKEWGEGNVEEPEISKTVKYFQDFQTRVLIDFEAGEVVVESLVKSEVEKHLKEAIIMALLMPEDPREVDLFDTKEIKLGETPFLYNEVVDDQNKPIRWEWRANRYADILIKNSLKSKSIKKDKKSVKVSYVQIPMVKAHAAVRENKFAPLVKTYAARNGLSEALVYAIIETESSFNQYAISKSGAVGLMQIMRATAGVDAYKELTGKSWEPTREYLFDSKNNIELGTIYLRILRDRYLAGIKNPTSSEYCVISGYNGGAGTVLKTFHSNRNSAIARINSLSPDRVYKVLNEDVPYKETRDYIKKVTSSKKRHEI